MSLSQWCHPQPPLVTMQSLLPLAFSTHCLVSFFSIVLMTVWHIAYFPLFWICCLSVSCWCLHPHCNEKPMSLTCSQDYEETGAMPKGFTVGKKCTLCHLHSTWPNWTAALGTRMPKWPLSWIRRVLYQERPSNKALNFQIKATFDIFIFYFWKQIKGIVDTFMEIGRTQRDVFHKNIISWLSEIT